MMMREWFEWFEVVRSWHFLLELTENDNLKTFASYILIRRYSIAFNIHAQFKKVIEL